MKIKAFIIILFLSGCVFSWAEGPDVKQILIDIDNLSNFEDKDFSCIYKIVTEKPGEEQSATEALLFRRDRKDQFVLIINKPKAQKGQGYLQIDDNVFFYDPDSREFEHSSLSENITDSDAKNSDFSQYSLSEDYNVESWEEGIFGSGAEALPVYILFLKAKNKDVSYDRMKIWVYPQLNLLLKSEEYGFSGNLMRTTQYFDYKEISKGKMIPTRILMTDNLNIGEKTQVTLSSPSVNTLPDDIFSKNFLERVNQ